MRKIRLKLCVLLLLVSGLAGLQAQTAFVREKSGSQTSFEIKDINKLVFLDGKMEINQTNGVSDIFNLTEIRYLNFVDLSTFIPVNENILEGNLLIYPNPVRDIFTVQYMPVEGFTTQIEILTSDGKIVYKQQFEARGAIINQKIQITGLLPGLYLCRLINGNTSTTKKIIINQ